MTDKRIRIGTDDFSELRGENGYFVDKSLLIREIIVGSEECPGTADGHGGTSAQRNTALLNTER